MKPFLTQMAIVVILPVSAVAQSSPVKEMSVDGFVEALTPEPRPLTRGLSRGASAVPRIDMAVTFEFGAASLTEEAEGLLSNLGQALQAPALADQRFKLAGHTDAVGSHEVNDRLSLARAQAVRDFLVSRFDIPAERLQTEGNGKRALLFPDRPEADENRRVEISVVME